MKNSKQSLNELDISTYLTLFTVGKLIAGGVAWEVTRKVIKYFGSSYKNTKAFFSILRNPKKLKQAGVTDDEARALYANRGAAIVDLGKQLSKEVFKKVKSGKITPEQAIKDLDGIIPESAKQDWLKKFKSISPKGTRAATTPLKSTWTKAIGNLLPLDNEFKAAARSTYGLNADVNKLYGMYETAFNSGKLGITFKTKAVFPTKQEWLAKTGYSSKPNLSINDNAKREQNTYNWQKFIWTLYR